MERRKDGENRVATIAEYIKKSGAENCCKCAYRAWNGCGGRPWHTCEFLLLTGMMRGCSVAECTRFTPMTREIERYLDRVRRGVIADAYPLKDLANGEIPAWMRQKEKPKEKKRVRLNRPRTPEETRAYHREYRAKHRERLREKARERRARQKRGDQA